jgi:hypothetical protein
MAAVCLSTASLAERTRTRRSPARYRRSLAPASFHSSAGRSRLVSMRSDGPPRPRARGEPAAPRRSMKMRLEGSVSRPRARRLRRLHTPMKIGNPHKPVSAEPSPAHADRDKPGRPRAPRPHPRPTASASAAKMRPRTSRPRALTQGPDTGKQPVGSGPVGAQDGTHAPSNGRLPPGNAGGLGVQTHSCGGAAFRWTGRRFR